METSVRTQAPTPSGEAGPARASWWKQRSLRITAVCLTVMVVLGIGVRIALPTLLVAVGNNQCARHLASPARLRTVQLGLLDYRVTVRGLTVDQPAGFGSDLFLDLPEVTVKLTGSSLLGSPRTVDEVAVVGATLHLVRDRDGNVNAAQLLRPAEGESEAAGAGKPIHVKRITVENLTIRYTDFALSEEPVEITVNRLDAVITDVYLDAARSGEHSLPGKAEMTAHIVQPGFADALLGIIARFGYLDPDQPIPAANAAIRLGGLELRAWQELARRGVSQAIGGDIMDVNVDVALAAEMLDCAIAIITPAGDALRQKIGGTPRQPLEDPGGIRGVVGARAKEAGLNTIGSVAGTGGELGRTAVSSTIAAGKGAGKTVWGIATGLFKTASSVSKGNMSAAGGNLWDTASAGVTNTADMLGSSGASLAAGVVKAGSATGGGDRDQMWRADTQQRWVRSWEEARTSVENKPFPRREAEAL